jgi:hypothetical protein
MELKKLTEFVHSWLFRRFSGRGMQHDRR